VNVKSVILLLFASNHLIAQKSATINYLHQKPPGMVAELFAPGIVSTRFYEHSAPAFSPDGSVVLWTVMDSTYRGSLLEMQYKDGKWSKPARPAFADTTADDFYPSFSPDGKKLFFSSRRKVPGYTKDGNIRIWGVDRNQNGWGTPVPFDTAVLKGQDYGHSVTSNGTIYFSSLMEGGTNFNIRKSEKVNGRHTQPVLLPYNINSVDYEDGPYIAPDESFLIFESQRPEGINGYLGYIFHSGLMMVNGECLLIWDLKLIQERGKGSPEFHPMVNTCFLAVSGTRQPVITVRISIGSMQR
jgi:hypothetical protein